MTLNVLDPGGGSASVCSMCPKRSTQDMPVNESLVRFHPAPKGLRPTWQPQAAKTSLPEIEKKKFLVPAAQSRHYRSSRELAFMCTKALNHALWGVQVPFVSFLAQRVEGTSFTSTLQQRRAPEWRRTRLSRRVLRYIATYT